MDRLRELILEDRPLIYWAGDDPRLPKSANLASVRDLSGTGRTGTMQDMIATDVPVPHGAVPAVGWQSDGSTTRYIDRAYDSELDVQRVTVECVARLDSKTTIRALWNRNNDAGLQWDLRTNTAGQLMFSMRESEFGAFVDAVGLTDLSATGRWHHLVGVYSHLSTDPGPIGATVYVDGVREATTSGSVPLMTGSVAGVRFGKWLDNRFPWLGRYAAAALYNYPLSSQRIAEHARAFHAARHGADPRVLAGRGGRRL